MDRQRQCRKTGKCACLFHPGASLRQGVSRGSRASICLESEARHCSAAVTAAAGARTRGVASRMQGDLEDGSSRLIFTSRICHDSPAPGAGASNTRVAWRLASLFVPRRIFSTTCGRNCPLAGSTAGRTLMQLAQQISGARSREWLVINALGGFACGTLAQANTRRYHRLLVASLPPPVQRVVVVA